MSNYEQLPNNLTPEQQEAKDRLVEYLSAGKSDLAARQKRKLSPKDLQTEDVRKALKSQFSYNLANEFDWINEDMLAEFPMSDSEIKEAALDALKQALSFGQVTDAESIQNKYKFSEELLAAEDVQKAARKGCDYLAKNSDTYQAEKLKKLFFSK